MQRSISENGRNLGVDLLRIVSMIMIPALHVIGQGGVFTACAAGSAAYASAWLVETLCYCGVDCFAMISGYVGVAAGWRARRGVMVWLGVVFWTILITAAFAAALPDTVTAGNITMAIFPVTTKVYWYISAWMVLFLFQHFLNSLLLSLSQRELKWLCAAAFVVATIWSNLGHINVVTALQGGYSAVWLILLYLFGGSLRLLGLEGRWKTVPLLLTYLAAALLSWGWKLLSERFFPTAIGGNVGNMLILYTSPTIVLCAAALLLLFAGLRLREGLGARLIRFFSPLALGVYIIHTHPLVWDYLLYGRFAALAALPWPLLALASVGCAAGIFLICALLDELRQLLFRALRVPEAVGRLSDRLAALLEKKKA